jgi:DNA-binding XRE family transcriptional regulator
LEAPCGNGIRDASFPSYYVKEKSVKVNIPYKGFFELAQTKTGDEPPISAAMIRAARGLLNISQAQLGELVKVSTRTLIKIEQDSDERLDARRRAVHDKIRRALEEHHLIEFIFPDTQTGEGVRIRSRSQR